MTEALRDRARTSYARVEAATEKHIAAQAAEQDACDRMCELSTKESGLRAALADFQARCTSEQQDKPACDSNALGAQLTARRDELRLVSAACQHMRDVVIPDAVDATAMAYAELLAAYAEAADVAYDLNESEIADALAVLTGQGRMIYTSDLRASLIANAEEAHRLASQAVTDLRSLRMRRAERDARPAGGLITTAQVQHSIPRF